jgi:hypothetical protein
VLAHMVQATLTTCQSAYHWQIAFPIRSMSLRLKSRSLSQSFAFWRLRPGGASSCRCRNKSSSDTPLCIKRYVTSKNDSYASRNTRCCCSSIVCERAGTARGMRTGQGSNHLFLISPFREVYSVQVNKQCGGIFRSCNKYIALADGNEL